MLRKLFRRTPRANVAPLLPALGPFALAAGRFDEGAAYAAASDPGADRLLAIIDRLDGRPSESAAWLAAGLAAGVTVR